MLYGKLTYFHVDPNRDLPVFLKDGTFSVEIQLLEKEEVLRFQ